VLVTATARSNGSRRRASAGRLARLDILCGQIATGRRAVVCFTDGITEALSPDGDEFGDDRLVDLIRANRTISADALATISPTRRRDRRFAQDDATLIVVAID
jgi:hypothetical protein